jgi:hypothetical protein
VPHHQNGRRRLPPESEKRQLPVSASPELRTENCKLLLSA